MTGPALVVPVQLDALSVNAQLIARDGFRWWRYDYAALDEFSSPEPVAQQDEITGGGPGVHLHWVIPDALRQGVQDARTGTIEHPLVPNRWLVSRFVQGATLSATSWVVESDCPYSPASKAAGADVAQMSMCLVDPDLARRWAASPDPCRNTVQLPPAGRTPYAMIGVAFPLAQWQERDPDSAFLTALAPGNVAFPIYTPHNRGVFSFYDAMAGVPAGAGAVSYAVVGWHSSADDDPLAGWAADGGSDTPYLDALSALDWSVAGDRAQPATRTLYEGLALGVAWDPSGPPACGEQDPLAALKHSPDIDVGVGNTTTDAFTSLLAARAPDLRSGGEQLLRAFQYDLLPVLGEVNGEALLDRSIRRAWHGSTAGGYRWEIVAAEDQDASAATLTVGERTWLAQLNADQLRLDLALGDLDALQWRFHELWWKAGRYPSDSFPDPPPGVASQEQLTQQLDPAFVAGDGTASVARQLLDQLATVRALADRVPQPDPHVPDPQDALTAGIGAFARARGLDATAKVLKAVEAPRYWMPNDPVVVVSGVQPPDESTATPPVARLQSDLVASLTVDGVPATLAGMPALAAALPARAGLPDGVGAVLAEWLLVDPANATLIGQALGKPPGDVARAIATRAAPAYSSPLPALGLIPWVQPWQPMFVEWAAAYAPLGDGAQWAFDGEDYRYAPRTPATATPQSLSGISLLSPHAQVVMGARLQTFLDQFGGSAELRHVYEEIFGGRTPLPVLTQALTGFNAQLTVRDQRAMRRPAPAEQTPVTGSEPSYSIAELAGFPDADAAGLLAARYRGAVTTAPFMVAGVSPPFQPLRQGQMWFTYLALYDKFGRTLTVVGDGRSESGIHDAANFPAVVDPAMAPTAKAVPNVASVVELPPRILQPTRLDFDLVDGRDDARLLWRDADANPVCGWLLPNHLDHSVLVFGPDGTALGEVRLVVAADGTRSGHWDPPPHGDVRTMADVAAAAPRLAQMISAPALAQEAAFDAFLDAIDTTLWTTDPLGARRDQALSVLIGRPLALVRASLRLSLRQPPRRDPSWAGTFAAPSTAVQQQPFAVRLGDLATRDDGLIGYFAHEDYSTLNTVATPRTQTAQGYVHPIGAPGADGPNYLALRPDAAPAPITMLVDPRAGVHATTGVVPVVRADLPGPFVARALRRLEVTFRLEPALTYVQPTPTIAGTTPDPVSSVVLPIPSERAGTWTFWDQEPAWTPYGLVDATPGAELKPYLASLRDGRLQLVVDLADTPPPT